MSSDEEIYDDIDKFHINNQKSLINLDEFDDKDDPHVNVKSVFPVLSSDEEMEEEDKVMGKWQKFMEQEDINQQDDFEESGDDNLEEGDGVTRENWGTKKALYYSSDTAYARSQQQSKHKSGMVEKVRLSKVEREHERKELLKMEEEEALILQKQMMQELKDEDFGLDFVNNMAQKLDASQSTSLGIHEKDSTKDFSGSGTSFLHRDLTKLSVKEKAAILKRESPEFLPWCRKALAFAKELFKNLHPTLNAYLFFKLTHTESPYKTICRITNLTDFAAIDKELLNNTFTRINPQVITLLSLKRQLISLYLVNFTFYLYGKAEASNKKPSNLDGKQASTFNLYSHPVILRLQMYRKLLDSLNNYIDSSNPSLRNQIQELPIDAIFTDRNVEFVVSPSKRSKRTSNDIYFQIFGHHPTMPTIANFEHPAIVNLSEVKDENIDLPKEVMPFAPHHTNKFAQKGITNKKYGHKNKLQGVRFAHQTNEHPSSNTGVMETGPDQEGSGKRPINYTIAKNKGLTPKRKKEYKNPRVKHKLRYRKALIKRKSQVRIPRKEIHKYTGERTGIKVGLKRSTKIK